MLIGYFRGINVMQIKMKTLVRITLLVAIAAGFTSCEKIKSIFDVEVDTTLEGDIDIDIQEQAKKSTENYTFSSSATIDPMSNSDIEENVDKIKEFAVNGVEAEVVFVNKPDVVFKAGTSFSIYDGTDNVTWTLSSDWPVVEGTVLNLDDGGGIYDAIADILDRKGVFTVSAQGECSETDVFITIRIGIDTTVTGNPL